MGSRTPAHLHFKTMRHGMKGQVPDSESSHAVLDLGQGLRVARWQIDEKASAAAGSADFACCRALVSGHVESFVHFGGADPVSQSSAGLPLLGDRLAGASPVTDRESLFELMGRVHDRRKLLAH